MPSMRMVHEVAPEKVIYDKIGMKKLGVIPGFQIFGNRVLLGVYERPEKTKSGLFISDQTRKEDANQGKSALVLQKGASAFVSDDNFDFKGDTVEVGDWVCISVTDGRPVIVNGQLCRVVRDQDITMKIAAPDSVF